MSNSKKYISLLNWFESCIDGKLPQSQLAENPKLFENSESTLTENFSLNRYGDILPYNYNRVRLKSSGMSTDYINASLMQYKGENINKKYIATQAPKPKTMFSFWLMVVQQGIDTIISLSKTKENNRNKVDAYWPTSFENIKIFTNKDKEEILVTFIKNETIMENAIRKFELQVQHKNQNRAVELFFYDDWPDHGIPTNFGTFSKLIKIINKYNKHKDAFPLIHCSAGCGRTGAFIVIDTVMSIINQNNKAVSSEEDVIDIIHKVLENYRMQRAYIVQTDSQLCFCVDYILFLLKEKQT